MNDHIIDKAMVDILVALRKSPVGLSLSQIQTICRLSAKTVKAALKELDLTPDAAGVYFDGAVAAAAVEPTPAAPVPVIEPIVQPKTEAAVKKSSTPRAKPYTPNPTRGYEVQKGKVKIFLDRKAASRTLTLSIADLQELVAAVQKAG